MRDSSMPLVSPLPSSRRAIAFASFRKRAAHRAEREPMAALVLLAAAPGTTVQDAGRPGWLHAGVPPSGPLDATAHAAANLAAGNDPRAAAIEIPLGPLAVRAAGDIALSIDGEPARVLAAGAELRVEACARAVRYLAVRGGIDVPIVLGSPATLVVSRFGGFGARPPRAGDAPPSPL